MTVVTVTGGSGQLGGALKRLSWPEGVTVVAPLRDEVDLADADAVSGYLLATGAQAVINAAAYTAVDRAESEQAEAFRVNAQVPAAIAEAARAADIPLVHVSTDYVFDGALARPYEVTDVVAPINVYGASKAAGELAVRSIQPRSAIVRTSWLVSAGGQNFVTTMLRLARERPRLSIVADQRGRPTVAGDLAGALAKIALRMIDDADAPAGVFHVANEGETTWFDFAAAIFAESARRGGPSPELCAIATADYATAARRPLNSRLSTARVQRDHGISLPPWRDRLPDLVAAILDRAPLNGA